MERQKWKGQRVLRQSRSQRISALQMSRNQAHKSKRTDRRTLWRVLPYREVHEAEELGQHLNHRTEAERWQRLTYVLRQILHSRNTSHRTVTLSHHVTVKVAHTRLPSIGFRSWSRFLAVSLQVTWVINPAVGCHYFLPGLQLPPQPLRGLQPILLLGEQRYDGCEQFAYDCYPTVSRLQSEPRPFCAWVQHTNHAATEPRSIAVSN